MNRFTGCQAAALGALAITLLAAPAAAKGPRPPQVTGRSSVTMPSYACQSAGRWMSVTHYPRTRVESAEVTSVRKPGYTYPISDFRVCGYMGSGTYTVKTKVHWSVAGWRWKQVPVYRYRDVKKPTGAFTPIERADKEFPFTCTLDGPRTLAMEYRGVILMATYQCAPNDSSGFGSFDQDDSTVYLPNSNYRLSNLSLEGEMTLTFTEYYPPFSEVPPTITGTTTQSVEVGGGDPIYRTVTQRYVHHYRQTRVRRWIHQTPVVSRRTVQVTVR